jgi:hypothetical protein
MNHHFLLWNDITELETLSYDSVTAAVVGCGTENRYDIQMHLNFKMVLLIYYVATASFYINTRYQSH